MTINAHRQEFRILVDPTPNLQIRGFIAIKGDYTDMFSAQTMGELLSYDSIHYSFMKLEYKLHEASNDHAPVLTLAGR